MRPIIKKVISKFEDKIAIPEVSAFGPIKLSILVRIIPGLPLTIQSYFLTLCKIPLAVYFSTTLLIQSLWAAGFMLMGGAFMSGRWFLLGSAAVAIILLTLIARTYARRLKVRQNI